MKRQLISIGLMGIIMLIITEKALAAPVVSWKATITNTTGKTIRTYKETFVDTGGGITNLMIVPPIMGEITLAENTSMVLIDFGDVGLADQIQFMYTFDIPTSVNGGQDIDFSIEPSVWASLNDPLITFSVLDSRDELIKLPEPSVFFLMVLGLLILIFKTSNIRVTTEF